MVATSAVIMMKYDSTLLVDRMVRVGDGWILLK